MCTTDRERGLVSQRQVGESRANTHTQKGMRIAAKKKRGRERERKTERERARERKRERERERERERSDEGRVKS